ncbi:MAG: GNAT family N-acetyltransferase [Oscillospiraceae bacterium]|jgi:GNAT superfamily N-acetyltransferase|nr:GNAT family N-acetyltransferase [Oscillospiraceae bacterium]
MIRIADFEEYRSLASGLSRAVTNNYLLPSGARRIIARGNLFAYRQPGALFLFERREGYFKLFFSVTDMSVTLPPAASPLTAFIVRRGSPDDTAARWLAERGFGHAVERIRMTARTLNVEPSMDGVADASPEEAHALFLESFDILTADLPLPDAYGRLLAVRDGDGSAAGILHAGSPRFIAVRPDRRRRGIAARLYGAYSALRQDAGVIRAWVDADNAPAVALYGKLGFVPDGTLAEGWTFVKESS